MIIALGEELTHGSLLTLKKARDHDKPMLHVHHGTPTTGVELARFIDEHCLQTLNVAGPHASNEPGVGEFVQQVLEEMLRFLDPDQN